jgi:hypothetical protein
MTSGTKPHPCRGLSTVVYDLSNLPEHGDPSLWNASEMDRVRELAGGAGVFVHVFVYQGRVMCHPLVVAPSGLQGAGAGAFTLMGLQGNSVPALCDNDGSAHRAAGAWRAAPTRNLLGIYNGVVVPKGADATDEVPRLAALKVMRVRGFACGVSPPQATRKSYAASWGMWGGMWGVIGMLCDSFPIGVIAVSVQGHRTVCMFRSALFIAFICLFQLTSYTVWRSS